MKFIADLHVHSRFSRATSKHLNLENLYMAAQLKGITVLGTGDFTHPGWFAEIKEKLVPAEPGLFQLKDELAAVCDEKIPLSCRKPVRFILETEISNIYKKDGKTRKNHNVVFTPDLDTAAEFNKRLDQIGNIKSDGRPILGLDAKNLLEITLDVSEKNFLIPAHIWTPWFSLLGSKSGFDSLEECFEDLSRYIFAVETGLSSDPAMNWRVSDLDNLTLVSNSDAHSPMKIGREANRFNTELSYTAIKAALESGDPGRFLGTLEFYPEEGKYHLDGHRKCNIRLWPEKTEAVNGICPQCGKPLTIGVLNRVYELADRAENEKPEKHHPFYRILPLTDILSEILQAGPETKRVQSSYHSLLSKLGPEFDILHQLPRKTIDKGGLPMLAEAIERMRQNRIHIMPGYDGEFGVIKIFSPEERKTLSGQTLLFDMAGSKKPVIEKKQKKETGISIKKRPAIKSAEAETAADLNSEQQQAVLHGPGPLLIMAGPGTGKTYTITCRMAALIKEKGISAENILALTFTNKAAQEMHGRLKKMLGKEAKLPLAATFHSFCGLILKKEAEAANRAPYLVMDETERLYFIREALQKTETPLKPQALLEVIVSAKQQLLKPEEVADAPGLSENKKNAVPAYAAYQELLEGQKRFDYEDLMMAVVRLFEKETERLRHYQQKYPYIFVDEYQDINYAQYRLIRLLAQQRANLCVIGDPDQSIYGFRGSDFRYFNRFKEDYPGCTTIQLRKNYRSSETILDASFQILRRTSASENRMRVYSDIQGIKKLSILQAASEKGEATAVGKRIESLVGGTGFYSLDFNKVDSPDDTRAHSFSDIAVLYRTHRQSDILAQVFEKGGIPFQVAAKEGLQKEGQIPLIISFLKLAAQNGSLFDFETVLPSLSPRTGPGMLKHFKAWARQNRLSFQETMQRAKRFPIPEMSRKDQQQLVSLLDVVLALQEKTAAAPIEGKIDFICQQMLSEPVENRNSFEQIIDLARSFEGDVFSFISYLALFSDTDVYKESTQKVSLMTMHAAKGLEFPVVFIVGCEKGFIPFIPRPDTAADIEEEQRLFYVAMTRAKEQLFLTHAQSRRIFGKTEKRERSPFVDHIEASLLHQDTKAGKARKKEDSKQLKLF